MPFTVDNAVLRVTCDACNYFTSFSAASVAGTIRDARDNGWKLKQEGSGRLHGKGICADCVVRRKTRKARKVT